MPEVLDKNELFLLGVHYYWSPCWAAVRNQQPEARDKDHLRKGLMAKNKKLILYSIEEWLSQICFHEFPCYGLDGLPPNLCVSECLLVLEIVSLQR